jgi:ADP-dependent NAD(P)H-hydrate dehydratase / NAD(P)H-hydrate epimerase
MKILTAQQVREADAYTIKHEPVASIDLMERAASRCVQWLLEHINASCPVYIYCGMGNNGGDGLAVARMLVEKGYQVKVFILAHTDKGSEDFSVNENRLQEKVECHLVKSADKLEVPPRDGYIIDAILGSGLNKPVEGFLAEIISKLNSSGAPIISIDIPSGLFADAHTSASTDNVIKAFHTLTFQLPKLSFMFPGNARFVGDFTVLDIGLDRDFINAQPSKEHFITKEEAVQMITPRSRFSHKGDYGHALLIAGSYGKMGAEVLAGNGCLRAGPGLVTMHVPRCGYSVIQTALPEAMVTVDPEEQHLSKAPSSGTYTAVGAGPGIGKDEQTQRMLKMLIQNSTLPLVLDADALNILGENKTWISFLPAGSILTPHPKEFERIAGGWKNDIERHELLRNFSVKHNVYVVLKGACTAIASPIGNVYFNSTGNPGMAKGGSGDVLTGIITGLMARGYVQLDACVLGVYLHGLAGDFAAAKLTEEAMTSGDIAGHLPDAWKFLLTHSSVE